MRAKRIGQIPSVNSAPPIAIDFGTGSLKALQLASGERHRIVACAQMDTPEELFGDPGGRLRFQIESLPKLIRKGKFSSRRAVCLIPSAHLFCKHMQLQLSEGITVQSLLAAMLPSQTGCDFETLVCRHHEVGGAGKAGKTEVICMAASRELVGRLMAAVKAAKLEPVGIHGPFLPIVRAFDDVNRRDADQARTTLYLDIGYGGTNVMIANGTDMVFARTVGMGGLHLDETIAEQLDVNLSAARELRWRIAPAPMTAPAVEEAEGGGGLAMLEAAIRRSMPEPEGAQAEAGEVGVSVAETERRAGGNAPGMSAQIDPRQFGLRFPQGVDLSEPLEMLTDEIAMCVRYHKSLFPSRTVESVVLVGGESRQTWLCQYLARGLRLPVRVGDPLARLDRSSAAARGVELGKAQPGWAAVLGACLSPTDL